MTDEINIGDPVRINSESPNYSGLVGIFGGFFVNEQNTEYGVICPINCKDEIRNGARYNFFRHKFEKITIEEFMIVKLENA